MRLTQSGLAGARLVCYKGEDGAVHREARPKARGRKHRPPSAMGLKTLMHTFVSLASAMWVFDVYDVDFVGLFLWCGCQPISTMWVVDKPRHLQAREAHSRWLCQPSRPPSSDRSRAPSGFAKGQLRETSGRREGRTRQRGGLSGDDAGWRRGTQLEKLAERSLPSGGTIT